MNINFKEGLRRIIKVLIGVLTLLFLLIWISCDFSFNTSKFYDNTFVIKKNGIKMLLHEYDNIIYKKFEFRDEYNNPVVAYSSDYNCNKWKKECKYTETNFVIKNNHKFTDFGTEYFGTVKMPSSVNIFLWIIQDLLIICAVPFLLYGLYRLFETATIWVYNGFKR